MKESATLGKPNQLIVNYSIEMTMDSGAISFKMVVDGQYHPFPCRLIIFCLREKILGTEYGSVKTEFV